MKSKDSEILTYNFQIAADNPACPPDLQKEIAEHLVILRELPEDKQAIEMCAEFYKKIHFLLKSTGVK